MNNESKAYGMAVKEWMAEVSLWLKVLIYVGINLVIRIRARQQSKSKGFSHWERDESSRGKIKGKHAK